MARTRLPLVFGGGLDRASGIMATEPSTFADLRNVHLRRGRAQLRAGLAARAAFGEESVIIAEHPIASQSIGATITYNTDTRQVSLYIMRADGTLATKIGMLWTLPTGSAPPVVVCADSYDKLFVAHDEPDFVQRQPTRVYDPLTGTLADLTADLNGDGTAAPIKFRGVARHLNFLFGWGYGTETPGSDNRPEIVRVSLPAEPTTFQPEHYFIAGQRGDPVVVCALAGGTLAVRKATESYEIVGYDRSTFGIRPLDTLYGCLEARLSVNVGVRNFFWSLEGPRVSSGGASEDLALDLGLDGVPVDVLAAIQSTHDGFATYVPNRREIWFVFGQWAFVLHLDDDALRWSYNQFAVPLVSAGLLYSTPGAAFGPVATATITSCASGPGDDADHSEIVLSWNNDGDLAGGEMAEVWLRPHYGATGWYKAADVPVSGPSDVATVVVTLLDVRYDVAVRLRLAGVYGEAYAINAPELWPVSSRSFTYSDVVTPLFAQPPYSLRRTDVTEVQQPFSPTNMPTVSEHPELWHRLEYSLDAQVTWQVAYERPITDALGASWIVPEMLLGTTPWFRYTLGLNGGNLPTEPLALRLKFPKPSVDATIAYVTHCAGSTRLVDLTWEDRETYDAAVITIFERNDITAGTGWTPITTFGGKVGGQANVPASGTNTLRFRVRYALTWHGVTDDSEWAETLDIPPFACP